MRQKRGEKNARWRFVTKIPRPVTSEWSLRASDIDSHHRKSLGTFRRVASRELQGIKPGSPRLLMLCGQLFCPLSTRRMKVDIWGHCTAGAGRVISSILGMGDTKWIQHSWHSALQAINYVHYANINKSVRDRPSNKLDYSHWTMSLLNSSNLSLIICLPRIKMRSGNP